MQYLSILLCLSFSLRGFLLSPKKKAAADAAACNNPLFSFHAHAQPHSLLFQGMISSYTLVSCMDRNRNQDNCSYEGNDVGYVPWQVESDLRVADVGNTYYGVECQWNHRHPDECLLLVDDHPDHDGAQCEQCHCLVGPCKVSPQNCESVCIELSPDQDEQCQCVNRNSQCKTLAVGILVDVECVRNHQTQRTQCCISGCDRQDNNTNQM